MTMRALMMIASIVLAAPALARETCAPRDPQAVAATMQAMYDAAARDDGAALSTILDPAFYAFDNGKRFDGMALPDMVKQAHAAGKLFRWTVTQPDVHLGCDSAWIAYLNDGAVGDARAMQPIQWLESANLVWRDGRWRVLFMQSQRRPAP